MKCKDVSCTQIPVVGSVVGTSLGMLVGWEVTGLLQIGNCRSSQPSSSHLNPALSHKCIQSWSVLLGSPDSHGSIPVVGFPFESNP